MRALLVLVVGLGVPGAYPAVIVARRSPAAVFLAPLIGALLGAVAAGFELGLPGSFVMWYVIVGVAANLGALVWWRMAGSSRASAELPWGWLLLTVGVVGGAMVFPLTGLRVPMTGYDANAIWLTHTLLVSGGHRALSSGLHNGALSFIHPGYPPLVPAGGALAFGFFGPAELHVAIEVTGLLNACALGVVGTGIAAVGATGGRWSRVLGLAGAGALCLAGFAVAGDFAVNGYADLLWSAAALGAVVWGLVLPCSNRALVIAWLCAAVAALTKNEGLVTALVVLVLISLRYRPLTLAQLPRWLRLYFGRTGGRPDERSQAGLPAGAQVREWGARAASVLVPAAPGLAWKALARLVLPDVRAVGPTRVGSLTARAGSTVNALSAHLAVVPVAVVVLVGGCAVLRRDRQRRGLGHPGWLWVAVVGYLVALSYTYVVGGGLGDRNIHVFLSNTVSRTTIFPQLALFADLAIWLLLALQPFPPPAGGAPEAAPQGEAPAMSGAR